MRLRAHNKHHLSIKNLYTSQFIPQTHHIYDETLNDTTPCPENKGTNSILGITSSNTDRFSKFFQCHNLLEICNKTVIKFPTTPQTRRYTTL